MYICVTTYATSRISAKKCFNDNMALLQSFIIYCTLEAYIARDLVAIVMRDRTMLII